MRPQWQRNQQQWNQNLSNWRNHQEGIAWINRQHGTCNDDGAGIIGAAIAIGLLLSGFWL